MRAFLVLLIVVSSFVPGRADEPESGNRPVVKVTIDPTTGQPRYDPQILFIEPGDTVLFESNGRPYANRSISGMLPEGASPWWGQVGKTVEVTFSEPGIYGHKCGAAYRLGLVGLIVVGDPSVNLESARSVPHPPKAAAVFEELFDYLEDHSRPK